MGLAILVLAALWVPAYGAQELEFTASELPWAAIHRGYSPPPLEIRTVGKCASGGIGFSVVSGQLPPGISLSSSGYFSGAALRTGTFRFAVRATDGCSWTARQFALTVADPPVLIAAPPVVKLVWRERDAAQPAGVLRVASTWPGIHYEVRVDGDWLLAEPERGLMAPSDSNGANVNADTVILRIKPGEHKPGRRTAVVQLSAWQAEPVRVLVECSIE
jgi:hypothetical protein